MKTIEVNNHKITALMDTGNHRTPSTDAHGLLQQDRSTIAGKSMYKQNTIDSRANETLEKTEIKMRIDNCVCEMTFHIVSNSYSYILFL